MTVQKINYNWGATTHIQFDPATDQLDFGWMQSSEFSISESEGSVVISINGNEQYYILDGVTLADMQMSGISALDDSAVAAWSEAISSAGGSSESAPSLPVEPVVPVAPVVAAPVPDVATVPVAQVTESAPAPVTVPEAVPTPQPESAGSSDPAPVVSGESTVTQITYNWGATTHLQFNPAMDRLDFGWMQGSEFSISEENGSVVISIDSNQQSYILDGVSLAEMDMSDISALDSSAISAWSEAITNAGGNGEILPVSSVPAGSASGNTVSTVPSDYTVIPREGGSYEFAPYVDMTAWPTPDLLSISQQSGASEFTLAFMVSDGAGGLSWGGVVPVATDTDFANGITAFTQAGGRVTLSFGGANGTEAAIEASSAEELAALYQTAIDKYQVDSIDFDIEGGALNDKKSIDMRNQAIAILEANNPNLEVSYTLPVLPDGLTQDGVNLLQSAVEHNARIDIVNIMAMDYGGAYDSQHNNSPDMGDAAISAADATLSQMRGVGLVNSKVGITPMIGVNDVNVEIFNLEDATELVAYAEGNPDVGRLSMWSIGRDNGSGAGQQWASSSASGLQQGSYDFAKLLGGNGADVVVPVGTPDLGVVTPESSVTATEAVLVAPVASTVEAAVTPATTPSAPVHSDYTVLSRDGGSYEFAPYVDMTAWPTPDLLAISQQSGASEFTLAFMVSDGAGGLSWGGVVPVATDTDFANGIAAFTQAGGSVTLSFGGANGTEAAIGASSAEELAALYQTAIDKYQVTSIDFDIEGGALNDKKSIDMRNQAIAILEANNPGLEVSYTLPVLPDGLTQDGVNLLQSAVEHNARIDIVNIMAMDYGGAYDSQHNNSPDMGDAAISAANATLSQMRGVGLVDSKVGITPMIGVNDVNVEIFNLEDATELVAYAENNPDVGRLSMWSIGRDNGSGAGQKWASSSASGLQQGSYDFAKLLGGNGADVVVPVGTPDQGVVTPDSSVTAQETALVAPVEPAVDAATPVTPHADYTISPRDGGSYEFAPYVDMTAWPTPDLLSISQKSGATDFTLAFMVSDGTGGLSWGGVVPVATDTEFARSIADFKDVGGHVTLSFGGAVGTEAALNATGADDLAALYQSAIDKYQVDSIDFDIEGGALSDKRSVDLRNQAIAILENNNPQLEVSYTLPVLPDGLTQDGVNLLQSAVDNHARIDIVNIMAMDYGGAYDSRYDNHPDMGDAAISAANSTLSQMHDIGMDSKVGITPMIGVNDDSNEIFTLADATELADYADSNADIGRLSMWSIGRDNGSAPGQQWATSSASGLEQSDYDFAKALAG